MNEDLERQIGGLQSEIETVMQSIDEGQEAIRGQAAELGVLKTQKADLRRELDALDKKIGQLTV